MTKTQELRNAILNVVGGACIDTFGASCSPQCTSQATIEDEGFLQDLHLAALCGRKAAQVVCDNVVKVAYPIGSPCIITDKDGNEWWVTVEKRRKGDDRI
jgi:hypothetical protein